MRFQPAPCSPARNARTSLAKYARYVEGNSTLVYTGGTTVDGEILVAGDI